MKKDWPSSYSTIIVPCNIKDVSITPVKVIEQSVQYITFQSQWTSGSLEALYFKCLCKYHRTKCSRTMGSLFTILIL